MFRIAYVKMFFCIKAEVEILTSVPTRDMSDDHVTFISTIPTDTMSGASYIYITIALSATTAVLSILVLGLCF